MNGPTTNTTTRSSGVKPGGKQPRSSRGGRVEIKIDLCKGCELCIEACPPSVLTLSPKLNVMGYHPAEYTGEGCTGCGICFYVCPEPDSITVIKHAKN